MLQEARETCILWTEEGLMSDSDQLSATLGTISVDQSMPNPDLPRGWTARRVGSVTCLVFDGRENIAAVQARVDTTCRPRPILKSLLRIP